MSRSTLSAYLSRARVTSRNPGRASRLVGSILPTGIPASLLRSAWSLRRAVGLSPTQDVFRELARRGVTPEAQPALEVFAGDGFRHTIDYARLVKTLEAWERSGVHESMLRRNLPRATIKITDTFEEIRTTPRRFGIIVVDNTITTFGGGRVEHFDLFPDVFRIALDPCVLILNICPKVPPSMRSDTLRLERRAEFYGTATPEDVPISTMVERYAELIAEHGFLLDWHFSRPRAYRAGIHYLVTRMSRTSDGSASDA